jgi:hypothetical protein
VAAWGAPSPAFKSFVQILRRVKLRDMTLGQAAMERAFDYPVLVLRKLTLYS